ncbi:bacteriorhodopsin [Micromonospora sp. NPDC049799]|uniref:bacteriorhodopsin n=1 Tax=Micromonospora sp. NPDC049799 TaxID=3154741 RepID=UPI0033FBE6CF
MTGWWLWLYVASMAAGLLLFVRWAADPRGVPRIEYHVAIAIPLWSGFWYTVTALGGGQTDGGGHLTYWARYADWAVSASLLLVALALTATHALPRRHPALLATLIGINVAMILSGLLADLADGLLTRWLLYAFGTVALLVIYALIWGPLRSLARRQPSGLHHAYWEVALLLTVLWAGYPVIWLLGPPGLDLLGASVDTALFVLLSIVSKVGWSILDLGRLRQLAARGELPVLR